MRRQREGWRRRPEHQRESQQWRRQHRGTRFSSSSLLSFFSPLLHFSPIKFSQVLCLNSCSFFSFHFFILLPTPFILQSLKSFYSYFNLYFFLFLFFLLLPILLSTFPAPFLISVLHISSYSSSLSISSPLLLLFSSPFFIFLPTPLFLLPVLVSTLQTPSSFPPHNSLCSSSSSSSKHKLPRRNITVMVINLRYLAFRGLRYEQLCISRNKAEDTVQ